MKYERPGLGDGPARPGDRQRLVAADRRANREAAPVELLQVGIRLQDESGIETVDGAIAAHGGRRVHKPCGAIDAGADDLVRDETRGKGFREIAVWEPRPALDRFERQSLRGGGDVLRVPLAGQSAPDRGQHFLASAHAEGLRL